MNLINMTVIPYIYVLLGGAEWVVPTHPQTCLASQCLYIGLLT
jgi:hypothetical protein